MRARLQTKSVSWMSAKKKSCKFIIIKKSAATEGKFMLRRDALFPMFLA